jgi:hypothetical protein
MSETTIILRTLLYQLEMSESLEQARLVIRVLCAEDDISAVMERVQATKKLDKKGE